MTAAILYNFLNQAPKLEVGESYLCRITTVESATQFSVLIKGASRPVSVSLLGLRPPPRTSWAFEEARQHLLSHFGPDAYPELSLRLRVATNSKGDIQGDFFYAWQWRDTQPKEESLSDQFLWMGLARLSKPDPVRDKMQAYAREFARGMWTRRLPLPKAGETFLGGAEKVYSPTSFRVRRVAFETCNTSPMLKVRVGGILPPRKGTDDYDRAMTQTWELTGDAQLEWTGMLRWYANHEVTYRVRAYDKDGTVVCSVSYQAYTYANDKLGVMRQDYAALLLSKGLAKIDPKLKSAPNEWVQAQTAAKALGKGIWSKP